MKRLLIAAAFAAAATLTFASSAFAWKPYTHVQSGLTARADAVDDGKVAVAGKSYPVDSRVVDALRDWPSYYNAGVVGPDEFPDLTMGKSIIIRSGRVRGSATSSTGPGPPRATGATARTRRRRSSPSGTASSRQLAQDAADVRDPRDDCEPARQPPAREQRRKDQ